MKVVKSNNISCFDVDNTLVMWDKNYRLNSADNSKVGLYYGGEVVQLKKNKSHMLLLKQFKLRGDTIIVWSQNGYEWAEQVIAALKLENYVDFVMSKPLRHVDDKKEKEYIVGNYVYLEEE